MMNSSDRYTLIKNFRSGLLRPPRAVWEYIARAYSRVSGRFDAAPAEWLGPRLVLAPSAHNWPPRTLLIPFEASEGIYSCVR